jgi:alpha-galactosidase
LSHKIAVVGGGSTVFSPQLIRLLVASSPLQGSTIVLMDIDAQRVELMRAVAQLAVAQAGADLTFESTTDRGEALVGADFVIVVAPVGGYTMRELDLEIPARYGIFTMGGETVGPAAMMRAFRHIPVLVDICHELEELSPDAWLFSYTNPTAPVLMAMERESSVKKACLCTCSAVARDPHYLAHKIGVAPGDLAMPPLVGGLNHCAAFLKLHLKDGRDAFPIALQHLDHPLEREMLERYDILPYCTGHWVEFFTRYMRLAEPYEGHVQGLKMMHGHSVRNMGDDRERAQVWEEDVQRLLAGAAGGDGEQDVQRALAGSEKQAELLKKVLVFGEGVEVVDVIEALVENRNEIHAVIVPNHGAIPNLPFDVGVEISAVVGGNGIHPIHVGPLPEPVAAVLRRHVDYYKLIVEAGLSGDRKLALDALLLDPVTSAVLTLPETGRLLDEMMEAEAAFLPQFA